MATTRGTRTLVVAGAAGLALVAVLAAIALLSSGGGEQAADLPAVDPGPVHVHGMGIDPADGALYLATHTGLYRVALGASKAERVGASRQDTMGFTVAGPGRFLGSGHPDLVEAQERDLPPHLGLLESTDAGRTWQPVSLLGDADFHVLRFAGKHVYGYDATGDRLLASEDEGRTWEELAKPGSLVDLAVSPGDANRLVAVSAGTQPGLHESRDGGRSWQRVADHVALLAWPGPLYLVGSDGQVFASTDGGRRLEHRGEAGGQPAAFLAQSPHDLYLALHDGTVKRSTDGGRTWTVRSRP